MRLMPLVLPLALAVSSVIGTSTAYGQDTPGPGGVAESGMGQGHASITTRSDVSISLESVPGTSGARIAVLGRAVTSSMTQIRACYAATINTAPGTHGRMRLRLDMPASGPGTTTVVEDAVNQAPLLRCVTALLVALPLDASLRPASAVVVLDFDNTAAQGAAEVAQRQTEADSVAISRESGRPEATGDGNAVHFTVRGAADATDEVVTDAVRVMRTVVPGLLDCRRRAGRRGQNPEGILVFSVVLRAGAAPTATAGRGHTVADTTAPRCVATAISRAHRRPTVGARLDVEIRFDR
ncbi:MAG: hypothetical protein J0L92_33500 [Deltaproteobacteria bacterium]|nr:hypothetical protein [Deltaproteobacteria bacterium]